MENQNIINGEKGNDVNHVLPTVITDIEKEFMLEDFTVGKEIENLNGKYRVVSNDLKQIVLEPVDCNILYKYSFDLDKGTETYRQIIDGKIVDKTG